MNRTIVMTTLLAGLGAVTLPASALPIAAPGVLTVSAGDVVQARMSQRERMRVERHRSMRHHGRRYGGNGGGHSIHPSRPPGMKGLGQTTGGPRY